MDKLFEVKMNYTFKEHLKFNYTLFFKGKEFYIYLALSLIVLICGIIGQVWYAVILAILLPIVAVFSVYLNAKKNYFSNKAAKDAEIIIEFYKDYMIQKLEMGSYKVEHDNILKIFETKTNFYVLISRNQGLIIPKENMPEGLDDHIRNISIKK